MKIIKQIKLILTTFTLKQTFITFTATFINGTLGLLFYILAARYLGPDNFGILTVSLTILSLVADIGNFGINAGIVNFVSKYRYNDVETANRYLKLSLELKIIIGIGTAALGYFLAPILSFYVFHKPELVEPLRLAFIGVGTTWLFSFATSYFQAFEKFISWGIIQIATNSFRLLLILIFFYQNQVDVKSTILSYTVMPLVGFLFTLSLIPKKFFKSKEEFKLTKTFFGFNKWVGVSAIASSFSSRVDTFISAALLTTHEVGIYSAAYQIVQVVPQLITALGTVIAPRFASFKNKKSAVDYYAKTQKFVVLISFLGLSGIPVFKVLIPRLMGSSYNESFLVFSLLLVGMLVFLLATPIHNMIVYFYNFPKILSYLSFINLLIIVSAGYFAAKNFGIVGIASITIVINLLNLLIPAFWLNQKNRV